jgi:hypothetical protein
MAIELTTATVETISGIREALSISTSLKPAKNKADVLNLKSYNTTINGGTTGEGGIDKFQMIFNSGSGELNFSVIGGTVNGSPVCPSILGDLSSTTVNASNLDMRNDGRGAYYSNYVDYLNEVFEKLGLHSRISGGSYSIPGRSQDRAVFMKYYRSENFNFIFEETVTGLQGPNGSMRWRWKTIDGGFGVADGLETSIFDDDSFRRWYGSL